MAKAAPVSVGNGGDVVAVADMALAGSGYKNACVVRVVGKETVKTR
jgi:hypothetical protein